MNPKTSTCLVLVSIFTLFLLISPATAGDNSSRTVQTDNISVTFDDAEDTYDDLITDIENGDYEAVANDATTPFTAKIGNLFYLFLFLMPFGLMWKKQEKLTMPTVLALICGSFIIVFVPDQFREFIIMAVILSVAYNLYLVVRDV